MLVFGYTSYLNLANDLKCVYERLNSLDFSQEVIELRFKLSENESVFVNQNNVENAFYCSKINISPGLDNISGYLSKLCSQELNSDFQHILN